jgi:diguanylate cyclase (GGDEF)-like protein
VLALRSDCAPAPDPWDQASAGLPFRDSLIDHPKTAEAAASCRPIMNDQVLIVDDDPGTIVLLSRILAGVAQLRFATCGADALLLARACPPDLVLLDAQMPVMDGFEVCKAMRADPLLANVAVIFVTAHHEPGFEVSGFELGAVDFITKPVTAALVLARDKAQLRVKHLGDELRRIATIDELTGVANRRRFDELLQREWQRARRSGDPLSLLMIDVDHFKCFNDRHGHPAGDRCLRAVAQALASACSRPADLVARYGGEEFAVLLPQTPRIGAEHMAQGVLEAVAALAIVPGDPNDGDRLSVSVGASTSRMQSTPTGLLVDCPAGEHEAAATDACHDLVHAADVALYCAKHAGRARAHFLEIAELHGSLMANQIAPRASRAPRATA